MAEFHTVNLPAERHSTGMLWGESRRKTWLKWVHIKFVLTINYSSRACSSPKYTAETGSRCSHFSHQGGSTLRRGSPSALTLPDPARRQRRAARLPTRHPVPAARKLIDESTGRFPVARIRANRTPLQGRATSNRSRQVTGYCGWTSRTQNPDRSSAALLARQNLQPERSGARMTPAGRCIDALRSTSRDGLPSADSGIYGKPMRRLTADAKVYGPSRTGSVYLVGSLGDWRSAIQSTVGG